VLPRFVEQIMAGMPVTLTDPAMTRFMMTLDEAVDLVLHAFEHGKSGDIFVRKAPAATLQVLAEALVDVLGAAGHRIEVIGTRHGEKLHETLLSREERARAQETDDYFRIPADLRDLNYGKFMEQGEVRITESDDYTSHNTEQLGPGAMKEMLLQLDFIENVRAGRPAQPVD
jgi:UDP-N-acetylglucosamine 4,6-dehydratase/5-epimerase